MPKRLPVIPPHENEEAHRRLMVRLREMTPDEVLATSVRAGIHNPDGTLTEAYGGTTAPKEKGHGTSAAALSKTGGPAPSPGRSRASVLALHRILRRSTPSGMVSALRISSDSS